jgi:resolvase-like protein
MTKITADHLDRGAFVYIRQSTADQLLHNLESRRRQYGLADRARQLGWTTVEVIDDDLGRSGGGVNRPGFERLLAAICEGRVGAVFAIEARGTCSSRLTGASLALHRLNAATKLPPSSSSRPIESFRSAILIMLRKAGPSETD